MLNPDKFEVIHHRDGIYRYFIIPYNREMGIKRFYGEEYSIIFTSTYILLVVNHRQYKIKTEYNYIVSIFDKGQVFDLLIDGKVIHNNITGITGIPHHTFDRTVLIYETDSFDQELEENTKVAIETIKGF